MNLGGDFLTEMKGLRSTSGEPLIQAIFLAPQPLYTPVISTVGLVWEGGVHLVPDQPHELGVGKQSDLLLVRSRHVGAAGVEVSQEHHVLRREHKTGHRLSAAGVFITCRSNRGDDNGAGRRKVPSSLTMLFHCFTTSSKTS